MLLLRLAVATAVLAAGGCATGGGRGEIQVFAASSLTGAFEDLSARFTKTTGIEVALQFAGSSVLATQIEQGAPVDVFASANETVMDALEGRDQTIIFATNELALVVPPSNPADINDIDDLSATNVILALCDAAVPCGSAADEALESGILEPKTIVRAPDVKAVVNLVALGEVDAGIVYESDVVGSGQAVEQAISALPLREAIDYPAATFDGVPPEAIEFLEYLDSPEATKILVNRWGFGPP